MDDDFDSGFKLAHYKMPCCNAEHALDQLIYDWPQGFSKFAFDLMNPNIGEFSDQHKKELEQILGTKLRVIYQHL